MLNNLLIDKRHNNKKFEKESSIQIFAFWVYLMSDLVLFSCLFIVYSVLVNNVASGPKGKDIFDLNFVLIESFFLLFSSMTYKLAIHKKKIYSMNFWLFITFVLGLGFLIMEVYEFHNLISLHFGPNRSAFLSSFFTLVGTHGIHVLFGLGWIVVMMIHIYYSGITITNQTRLICLGFFWHFLDLIWICVFTIVYLLGFLHDRF